MGECSDLNDTDSSDPDHDLEAICPRSGPIAMYLCINLRAMLSISPTV